MSAFGDIPGSLRSPTWNNDGPFDHVWHWKGSWWRPIYRKGERCRVLCRGSKNSVLVEFEDGFITNTSRHAVRPAPDEQRRIQW